MMLEKTETRPTLPDGSPGPTFAEAIPTWVWVFPMSSTRIAAPDGLSLGAVPRCVLRFEALIARW